MSDKDFIDFLDEEEKLLDIGSAPRRARYSKPQERKEPNWEEIIYDAKFEVIGVGDMPKGEFAHCAFCGCRLIHFVALKRLTDNSTWKVGKTCIGRVGLSLPKSVKRVVIKRDTKKFKKVEEQPEKPEKKEVTAQDIQDLFDD